MAFVLWDVPLPAVISNRAGAAVSDTVDETNEIQKKKSYGCAKIRQAVQPGMTRRVSLYIMEYDSYLLSSKAHQLVTQQNPITPQHYSKEKCIVPTTHAKMQGIDPVMSA